MSTFKRVLVASAAALAATLGGGGAAMAATPDFSQVRLKDKGVCETLYNRDVRICRALPLPPARAVCYAAAAAKYAACLAGD
ncbi:hypothetical protein [Actinosynnema mirum]|uniref:Uncharacterized protein n=1 Tax=Actinosynnema mirum (strain ATCC 29888 / DSM 43827 / JCM 3225 / NBRC 14064 / NCIMB 13271 / NRRL B-12336 / IMRU 3971 / 101) TaxID=446462 RepID=C6WL37_ACTMD|nr:hypothetical protein [Actinosynnema mirum]ACU36390.1 hypothetical protein Amir_2450 [Actinosynnema mirum DSM 43827]